MITTLTNKELFSLGYKANMFDEYLFKFVNNIPITIDAITREVVIEGKINYEEIEALKLEEYK
jgi:hypothetical protein